MKNRISLAAARGQTLLGHGFTWDKSLLLLNFAEGYVALHATQEDEDYLIEEAPARLLRDPIRIGAALFDALLLTGQDLVALEAQREAEEQAQKERERLAAEQKERLYYQELKKFEPKEPA